MVPGVLFTPEVLTTLSEWFAIPINEVDRVLSGEKRGVKKYCSLGDSNPI
jgi:hypothetical protein